MHAHTHTASSSGHKQIADLYTIFESTHTQTLIRTPIYTTYDNIVVLTEDKTEMTKRMRLTRM